MVRCVYQALALGVIKRSFDIVLKVSWSIGAVLDIISYPYAVVEWVHLRSYYWLCVALLLRIAFNVGARFDNSRSLHFLPLVTADIHFDLEPLEVFQLLAVFMIYFILNSFELRDSILHITFIIIAIGFERVYISLELDLGLAFFQ